MRPLHLNMLAGLSIWFLVTSSAGQYSFDPVPPIPAPICSEAYYVFYSGHIRYTINGTRVMVDTKQRDTGEYLVNTTVIYQFSTLAENKLDQGSCSAISADTVQSTNFANCLCSWSDFVNPTPNTTETGIAVVVSGCPAPQSGAIFQFNFTQPQNTYQTTYETTLNGSLYPSISYSRIAGSIKIGLQLSNWNWSIDYIDSYTTYLIFNTSVSIYFDTPLNYSIQLSELAMNLTAAVPPVTISVIAERGVIFDGFPTITNLSRGDDSLIRNFSLPSSGGLWVTYFTGQYFCSSTDYPLPKWNDIYYDPTLTAAYSSPIPPPSTPPNSPTAKVQRDLAWIVAPVLIGVVLVAVAAVAIAYFYSPKFRHTVAPFTKRSEVKTTDSTSTGRRWKSGSPSLM